MRDSVFVSYSHRDRNWLERLQVYLAPLERRGLVRRWDDTLIAAGARWEQEILAALERTKVAVLLVSADFLASDFIARVELPRLLGSAEDQGVLIIPLVLDHCNFERMAELAQFQAIHSPALPLETLSGPEQKAVLAKLAAAVDDALQAVSSASAAVVPLAGRLFAVPARNPLFTGRDEVIGAVAQALQQRGSAALCALAGMGKTETAIEFAHRHRMAYERVCWVRADSEAQLVSGFCALAGLLDLPESRGSNQLAAAQAGRASLARGGRCLLVLDAAEDFRLVREWLPAGDGLHLLLTTRNAALTGLAEPVELGPFADDEAARFLLRRARLSAGDGGSVAPQLLAAARALAQATEGLPLALEQAGGYIEETACALEEYLMLWQGHRRQLLAERGQGSLREQDSLYCIWSLSLQELQASSPAAWTLLRLLAFFHNDAIPEAALQSGASLAGEELAALLANPMLRNAAVRDVLRTAFLRRDAKTHRLSQHRLMQQFIREELTPQSSLAWCGQAMDVLATIFPEPKFANWAQCDMLVAHAASALEHARELALRTPNVARLQCNLAYYLYQRGRFAEAEPLAVVALAMHQGELVAPEARARALRVMAQIDIARSRFGPAAEHLAAAEGLLVAAGADAELVRVLDLLGSVALACNELANAEGHFRRALARADAAGIRRSAEAAQCLNDLGTLCFRRADYAGARAAFADAATLRRELLEAGHPSIAQSLNNLAAVCARLNDLAAARQHYGEALALREAALGGEHPDVAESLLNLALLDLRDGQARLAEAELRRAFGIQLACRGADHPAVANVRVCLGDVAMHDGRLDEARAHYAAAHEARLRFLGPMHPDTARALLGLADVACAMSQPARALPMFLEARTILTQGLGKEHPEVVACEAELARVEQACQRELSGGTA